MYLSLDVESLGVNGQAFAWAGCLLNTELEIIEEQACHKTPLPVFPDQLSDYEWVVANVTTPEISREVNRHENLLTEFWKFYRAAQHPIIVADCPFPVEANFLRDISRLTSEPFYPIIDVASMLFAEGFNPTGTYQRLANEYPAHNPLNDARQAARLMRLIRQGRLEDIK
jgi:hypothetical protein